MDEHNEETNPTSPETPKPKVRVDQDPIKSYLDERVSPDDVEERFLSLLNVNMKELGERSDNYPRLDGSGSEEGRVWMQSYLKGIEHLLKGDAQSASVEREGSTWRQKVDVEGDLLGAGRPRFGKSSSNVISGEKALMKATSALGLGSTVQIPLWHTGIWVSIKAPSEKALLELERRIGADKVALGRYTSGMIFSNTSVYTVNHVVNFVLNHIYDASVKNITPDALKALIKTTDIPTLVWGIACAIYPNGYNYARPCTTNPAECQHVVKGLLNIAKLFWTDNDALSPHQRRHMQRRTDKFSDEELTRYQNEHVRGGTRVVTLKDELRLHLHVPSIQDYEASGFAWVDSITDMLEGAFGVSLRGSDRDNYIIDQGRLTALRQYSHWVSRVEVGEDIIEDKETIEELLETLSSDEDIADSFFEEVGKYIDDASISLVAIPKYDCPSCGGEQTAETLDERHPHLLPMDTIRIFFTLLDQRIFKALTGRTL